MLIVYLIVYVVTNMGAFLVVHAATGTRGDELRLLDGLYARNGWLAGTMLIFLLSLAGIPFVAGFWSKIFVFWAAWQGSLWWLVVLAALMSVVSLYYYLRVVDAVFMQPPQPDAEPITADFGTSAAIFICAALVVAIGVVPRSVVNPAFAAATEFEAGAPKSQLAWVAERYAAQAARIAPEPAPEPEQEPEIEDLRPEVLVVEPVPETPTSPLAAFDTKILLRRGADTIPRRYDEPLEQIVQALRTPPEGIAQVELVVEVRAALSESRDADLAQAQAYADLVMDELAAADVPDAQVRLEVIGSEEGRGRARNEAFLWLDDGRRERPE